MLESLLLFLPARHVTRPTCTHYNAVVKFVIPEAQLDTPRCAPREPGARRQQGFERDPLRFDVAASSLPVWLKARLLERKDSRITRTAWS